MDDEISERQLLAEQWRLIGESLRKRSPVLFEKLLAMLMVSASGDEEEASASMPQTYIAC